VDPLHSSAVLVVRTLRRRPARGADSVTGTVRRDVTDRLSLDLRVEGLGFAAPLLITGSELTALDGVWLIHAAASVGPERLPTTLILRAGTPPPARGGFGFSLTGQIGVPDVRRRSRLQLHLVLSR
jgi:hypothetical protein